MSQGDRKHRSRRPATVFGRVLWKVLVPVSLAGSGLPLWWTLAPWSVVRTGSGDFCRVTQMPGPEESVAGPFSSASDACRAAVHAIKTGQCTGAVEATEVRCGRTPSNLEIKTAANVVVAYPWKGDQKSGRLSVFLALDQLMTFPPHFGSDRIGSKSYGGVPCPKPPSELTVMLKIGSWSACLGHMADSRHLVTAGHCLNYSQDKPQPIKFTCGGATTKPIHATCVTAAGQFDLKAKCITSKDYEDEPNCRLRDIAVCKLETAATCVGGAEGAVAPYEGHREWIGAPEKIQVQSNLHNNCAKFDHATVVKPWPASASSNEPIRLKFDESSGPTLAVSDSGGPVVTVDGSGKARALGVSVLTGKKPLVVPIWALDSAVWSDVSPGSPGLASTDGAQR